MFRIVTTLVFLFSITILNLSCQNKPCREIQAESMKENKNSKTPVELKLQPSSETQLGSNSPAVGVLPQDSVPSPTTHAGQLKIKVFKPDGSLQCGMGAKIPIETTEKELKNIKVYSRSNKNDGLMRIQVCGAPTGQSHVFEIDKSNLERALKAGFKEWTQD